MKNTNNDTDKFITRKEIKPYINLLSAIYMSGVKEKDEEFLNSTWCAEIKNTISEFYRRK